MTTEAARQGRLDDSFWRDLPAVADYFSPAISTLQNYLGIGSREIIFSIGLFLGERASERNPEFSARDMLNEFVAVWNNYEIGSLKLERHDPVTLVISDCRICGQLPGTGDMYECWFHEGFFQGALSAKLARPVKVTQESNHEGTSGTWCRRLVADAAV
ncbi:MAG TPA: hypothetical protein VLY21_01625 [Nitrososphaerales archaeon]|nr:hypothetical protein [Nitrososphaerales archaeon]